MTERGDRPPPVLGTSVHGHPNGDSVQVRLAAPPGTPHVWVAVIDAHSSAYAHLSLEAATTLRDQLTALIEQVR